MVASVITTPSPRVPPAGNALHVPSGLSVPPDFLRLLALAAGFSCSAGWDWFPSMHPLWINDFFYLDGPSDPFGQVGSLSSFILVKTLLMLVLGLTLEKGMGTFLSRQACALPSTPWQWLAGHAHRLLFPKAGRLSSATRTRLYVILPFLLVQAVAFVLILFVTFFLPIGMLNSVPLLVGLISALLGLLWFSIIAVLPAVWCCLTCGFAALCSLGLYLLSDMLPPDALPWVRVLCPLLALVLLFWALPPTETIRELADRYQRPPQRDVPMPFLWRLTGTPFPWVGLYLFMLLYGLQFLLGFASGSLITEDVEPALLGQTGMVLASQALGALLATWLILQQKGHTLLIPLLGLALFGSGALFVSLINGDAVLIPSVFLHVAAGACGAFGISLLGAFFRNGSHVFRTVACCLFLLNVFGYFGGYGLWVIARRMQNEALASHEQYLQLLALLSLVGMLSLHALRQPLEDVFGGENPEFDPSLQLTRRERQVAELVQKGMKNLEISIRMNITEATLRVHLRHVYKKLGIQGRANLRDINLDENQQGK